jgi:AcrR family transcriptional regulator
MSAGATAATKDAPSIREQRRQQRAELSRIQILNAAEELFAEHGFDRTSLDAIAGASGFSVGGIYLFFENKLALYSEVMQRRGLVMQDRMGAWLQREVAGMDKLLGMVSAVFETLQEFPGYGRLVLHVATGSFLTMDNLVGAQGEFTAGLSRYAAAIEQGQREGAIRAGEPSRLAMLIAGMVTVQAQIDRMIAADPQGVGREDFLEIVRNALGT